MNRATQQGFTLLELVMVMLVIALASAPILGQFTNVATSLQINEDIQTAVQLAQERAEGILADRRTLGYAAVPAGTVVENLAGNYAGYVRTSTVTVIAGGSGGCAAGATCKEVIVSVPPAEITFILVDF